MHLLCKSFDVVSSWRATLRRRSFRQRDDRFRAGVSDPSLNPQKHWYVLTRQLCAGQGPRISQKNEVFRCFPDEIRSVATRERRPGTSNSVINRQPPSVYMVSYFARLLRQREILNFRRVCD